jgi:hypothetical protein
MFAHAQPAPPADVAGAGGSGRASNALAEVRAPLELRHGGAGRGLFAADTIHLGRTLIVSRPYAYVPLPGVCFTCYTAVDTGLRCSGCSTAYYCGKECQKGDWPEHKAACPGLRRAMVAANGRAPGAAVRLAAAICRRMAVEPPEPLPRRLTHPEKPLFLDQYLAASLACGNGLLSLASNEEAQTGSQAAEHKKMAAELARVLSDGGLTGEGAGASAGSGSGSGGAAAAGADGAAGDGAHGRKEDGGEAGAAGGAAGGGAGDADSSRGGSQGGSRGGAGTDGPLHKSSAFAVRVHTPASTTSSAPPAGGFAAAYSAAAARESGATAGSGGGDASARSALPLPHEVTTLFARLQCNVFTACDAEMRPNGAAMYPLAALINHSCDPNCAAVYTGKVQVIRSLRNLEPGEELTVAYVDTGAPTAVRRRELRRGYFFECNCPFCELFAAEEWRVHGDEQPRRPGVTAAEEDEERAAAARAAAEAAAADAEKVRLAGLIHETSSIVTKLRRGKLRSEPDPPPTNKATAYTLPIDAFTPRDAALMGVRCVRVTCKGVHILLPPDVRIHFHAPPLTIGILDGPLPRLVPAPHGDAGLPAPSMPTPHKPLPAIAPSVCTVCAKRLELEDADAALAVMARASKLVALHRSMTAGGGVGMANGGRPGAAGGSDATVAMRLETVLAAGPTLLAEMSSRLSPVHFQTTALANVLVTACVSNGKWQAAAAHNEPVIAGYRFAYAAGHPLRGLQHALQGKLLSFLGHSARAAAHLSLALESLRAPRTPPAEPGRGRGGGGGRGGRAAVNAFAQRVFGLVA